MWFAQFSDDKINILCSLNFKERQIQTTGSNVWTDFGDRIATRVWIAQLVDSATKILLRESGIIHLMSKPTEANHPDNPLFLFQLNNCVECYCCFLEWSIKIFLKLSLIKIMIIFLKIFLLAAPNSGIGGESYYGGHFDLF